MNEEKYKNKEEKNFILNEIKKKGVRGMIIREFENTNKGVIKY